ncbi:MAG: Gfo/Idh/MocA family oxidoreductase [Pedobacter sp.]|nr:Gfo/Idh/MocA family oxidoreductase [Chitinophagaceae bacterium]
MINSQPILIIGAGSIGERHIRNLWVLGYENLIVFRQRNLPFRDIGNVKVTVVLTWDEVLKANCFAVLICTPTAQHLQQTINCLNANIHVLVEKPLSHQTYDVAALQVLASSKNKLLQVGYMLRYHPLLLEVKEAINQKKYGNLINVQTYWGEYLPNWHPWENYEDSYAAKKEEGGGPALTLSHDIDVANWLVNADIVAHQALQNFASNLKVSTESAFDVNLSYSNKVTAHVHVNFCQKIPQRFYKFVFDEAVIDIDYFASAITISTIENTTKHQIENFDRNDMFIAQLQDFFARIEAGNYQYYTNKQIENSYNIINICNE